MSSRSRRSLLQAGVVTLSAGLGGCLTFLKSYPTTGLLIVNADDERRTVTVRVTDTEDTTLFKRVYAVPANEDLERENIVDTGSLRVIAYLSDNPGSARDEYFDFSGCRAARPVITIKSNRVDSIGKQDTCRPTESPYN